MHSHPGVFMFRPDFGKDKMLKRHFGLLGRNPVMYATPIGGVSGLGSGCKEGLFPP